MECNKDEAIRAKCIAEQRMKSGDFVGALRVARKAQSLYSETENISQIIAVSEVHCSAQNKLGGSERDWYGILQTEQLADEATIKKQFKKLALLLHPDKNKFAGAEAAFKLIGEANMVLSDKAKRSSYDSKCGAFGRTVATKPNGNSFKEPNANAQNFENNPCSDQSTNSGSDKQALRYNFWTSCQYCRTRFIYSRALVNRTLSCRTCSRFFTAYEMSVPPEQPSSNTAPQGNGGTASKVPREVNLQQSDPVSREKGSAEVYGHSKDEKKNGHSAKGRGMEGAGKPKIVPSKPEQQQKHADPCNLLKEQKSATPLKPNDDQTFEASLKPEERKTSADTGRKRLRKQAVNSHPSCKESNTGNHPVDNASFKESYCDETPLKRSRGNKASNSSGSERKTAAVGSRFSKNNDMARSAAGVGEQIGVGKQKVSSPPQVSKQKRKIKQSDASGGEMVKPSDGDKESQAGDGSSSDLDMPPNVPGIKVPDPDFSDFDKDKAENCFAVNQTWAIYDTNDGLPRFYACIKKVLYPGFKLQITWLEPDPDDQCEIDWCDADLPVSCGKFRLGGSENTSDCLMFSHQVNVIKGQKRGSYLVYPKKGETWAIFRNWDIKWSSDFQKKHGYEIDFVEILSEFDQDAGIEVAYLSRVGGFVSVFQRKEQNGIISFRISPTALYRFSHRIPSFRLTGEERHGVPRGSFELDTAALPMSLFGLCGNDDVKMKSGDIDAGVDNLCHKSSEVELDEVRGQEGVERHSRKDAKRVAFAVRRLPRSNRKGTDRGEESSSKFVVEEEIGKNLQHDAPSPSVEGGSTVREAGEVLLKKVRKHKKNGLERAIFEVRRSPRGLKQVQH